MPILRSRPLAPLILLIALACSSAVGVDDEPGPAAAPSVVSVVPATGATGVAPMSSVTITFSAPVDPATVTSTSFQVGGASGTIAVTGSSATFTPGAPYDSGSTQAVTVSGVRDLAGTAMTAAFTSNFTVVTPPPVAPIADAGPDRQVSMGASVSLDATASGGTNRRYTWSQLEGPDVGALNGVMPTFTAPAELTRLRFELAVDGDGPTSRDTVTLWVLEDGAHAYFVAPTGDDANGGTRAAPFATVQRAIDAADNAGNGGDVYVAAGSYGESLTLRSRVSIYGGFEAGSWRRDLGTLRPVIAGSRLAVRGSDANNLTLDGLRIEAASATDSSQSSIVLWLENSSGVVARRSVLVAGDGFRGLHGDAGASRSRADDGSDGYNAASCAAGTRQGGAGGSTSYSRNGGRGGNGGIAGAGDGSDGQGSSGGSGGDGGPIIGEGDDGRQSTAARAAGSAGDAGTGFGTLASDDITTVRAGNGGGGAHGWGGGGGGGGGGVTTLAGCGAGGGGGGAGGQGGGGGTGAFSGGHSIAVVLGGFTDATLTDLEITLGAGGRGGSGGPGGAGGLGGRGGDGGSQVNPWGAAGGDGADGTSGARGGGGGGGVGGSAIAVLEGADATSTRTSLTITGGTAGAGGTGGSASGGNAGENGSAGETLDYKKLP